MVLGRGLLGCRHGASGTELCYSSRWVDNRSIFQHPGAASVLLPMFETRRTARATASERFPKIRAAGAPLRSAHRREEFVDFASQVMAFARERLCRGKNLRRCRTGLGRT